MDEDFDEGGRYSNGEIREWDAWSARFLGQLFETFPILQIKCQCQPLGLYLLAVQYVLAHAGFFFFFQMHEFKTRSSVLGMI